MGGVTRRWLEVACLLGIICTAMGSGGDYFPANTKLPKVDMEQYDDLPYLKDFDMPMQGLNGHPARYLPVNYTRARFYTAHGVEPTTDKPCAFVRCALPSLRRHLAPRHGTSALNMCGRRRFLSLAGAALVGGGINIGKAEAKGNTIRDMMEEAAEAKAAKEAEIAKMPKRPTELRDKPQCFKWNGEEKCFSCTSECEYYKTLNPKLDCKQWCTVEYGQPKPTDEDSISFNDFVADLDKQLIKYVDFYGPNGDKCYATYKSDGHKIRIGEGFPVEIGNEASSPLFVVRLLQKKEVPYKFHFLDNVSYKKIG